MNFAYDQLPGLEQIYLEDSWVLGVTATYRELVFAVDFVLCEGHEFYRPAVPREQHCYRSGELRFSNVTDLSWADQTTRPAVDASGAIDYGNIDTLQFGDGSYVLNGDFGEITVVTDAPPTITWRAEQAERQS